MAAGGEANDGCLTPSTNWIVGRGSLHDSISFETSADDAPTPISGPLLLLRPPSDDPPPCEVTVCFREKHEVHRIYVRSEARVYEIYCASDQKNNIKEYLCTVRCGPTRKEVELPSKADGATLECLIGNDRSTASSEQLAKADIAPGDEDGWVEVKVHDSVQDDRADSPTETVDKEISRDFQMHYEATAEISDASPCIALTLRLLSLQTKTSVHIEEIYIYADPVVSTSVDTHASMGGSLAGNPLFAMLVPGLQQFSRSGTSRNPFNNSGLQKYTYDAVKATDTYRAATEKPQPQELGSPITDQDSESAWEKVKAGPGNTKSTFSHLVSDQDHMPKSILEENNLRDTRVEKILDELISKVGRIEAFCSRFEENMMKPISCIERRLQRLEEQLDAFNVRSHSSESFPSLKISAPEFSSDESDSEGTCSNTLHTDRKDATFADLPSSTADLTACVPAPQVCPSMIVKAPEFSSEDDDDTNNDETSDLVFENFPKDKTPSLVDSILASNDDTLDLVTEVSPMDKAPSSVDGALASALAALMCSTALRSPGVPKLSPTLMDKSSDVSYVDNNASAPLSTDATSELAGRILKDSDMEKNDCGISDEAKRSVDSVHSSLFADAVKAPPFSCEMYPALVVMAPEFPNDDYINYDDNSLDMEVKNGLSTLGLAAYLSSSMAKSASPRQTLVDVASKGCNFGDNNLVSSPVQVPCGEADESGFEKHVNHVNCGVYLDSAFQFSLPKCTLEVPPEEASPNRMTFEVNLEQEECNAEWHDFVEPNEVRFSTDNILGCKLNKSLHQKGLHGECANDNDAELAACRGPILNLLGTEWIEDNSSDSSVDEIFIRNKVQIDLLDDSSTDAIKGAAMHGIVSYSALGEPSAGNSHGKSQSDEGRLLDSVIEFYNFIRSRSEIEDEVNATTNYEQSILDVKFAPKTNWKGGDPLDVLLGNLSGSEEQISAVNADDAGVSSILNEGVHNSFPYYDVEQGGSKVDQFSAVNADDVGDSSILNEGEHNSFPYCDVEQGGSKVDQFLCEPEATEAYSFEGATLNDPGSSSIQLFSSLI